MIYHKSIESRLKNVCRHDSTFSPQIRFLSRARRMARLKVRQNATLHGNSSHMSVSALSSTDEPSFPPYWPTTTQPPTKSSRVSWTSRLNSSPGRYCQSGNQWSASSSTYGRPDFAAKALPSVVFPPPPQMRTLWPNGGDSLEFKGIVSGAITAVAALTDGHTAATLAYHMRRCGGRIQVGQLTGVVKSGQWW